MSAGPRLSRLAANDVRALTPVWIVCLAAMAASVALNLTPFRGFGVVLFFFGLAALGALSGISALQAKTDIVQVAQGIKPPKDTSRMALRFVPALYGAGVGIFLGFLALSYMAPKMLH